MKSAQTVSTSTGSLEAIGCVTLHKKPDKIAGEGESKHDDWRPFLQLV